MGRVQRARRDGAVLLIEDDALFAEAVTLALAGEGYAVRRLAPAGTDVSLGPLLAAAVRARANLVLLDLELGRHDGEALIRPLTRAGSSVVVVTVSVDRSLWGACLHHGAKAVIPKHRPLAELLDTLRRVEARLPAVPEDEHRELVGLWQQRRTEDEAHRRRLARLSPPEKKLLGRLMAGRTVRDICEADGATEATVAGQVDSILAKLEVSSQIAAVGLAHRAGWRPPGTPPIE